MKSLKGLATGAEYLWKGDPVYWGRTAPVLFPFVGGVYEKQFRTKGQTYPMGQHGFARDMDFTLLSQTEDAIWFVLESNEETLQRYPYAFILKLGYELKEQGVRVIWQVENPGTEDLPFSIGGHPAFNCPIDEGKAQTDYLLSFDAKESIVSTRLSGSGLATEARDEYMLQKGYLPITEDLFDKDALVVEHDQAHQVSLCRQDGEPYLSVTMSAPLFGVWSPPKKKAPFICIEPWYGRCDAEGFTGDLTERTWAQTIAPGETWQADFTIAVYE
jgi:galactose mutarotase-like enzyme